MSQWLVSSFWKRHWKDIRVHCLEHLTWNYWVFFNVAQLREFSHWLAKRYSHIIPDLFCPTNPNEPQKVYGFRVQGLVGLQGQKALSSQQTDGCWQRWYLGLKHTDLAILRGGWQNSFFGTWERTFIMKKAAAAAAVWDGGGKWRVIERNVMWNVMFFCSWVCRIAAS